MFILIFNLFICYFFLFIQNISGATRCVYDLNNGEKLDIRPLGNANGKTPKYDQIRNSAPTGRYLSWNACFDYSKSDGGSCTNAAVCYTGISSGVSTLVAKQSDAALEQHDNVNVLYYKHDDMLVNVYLTCQPEGPDSISAREDSATIVNIYLQSQCCCPGKCHYSEESSITGGGVFLIILVVLAFVYIVGGMIFMKASRGASGSEMIPNRLFWLSILSYIIGGIRYSLHVVRHRSLSVEYQKV